MSCFSDAECSNGHCINKKCWPDRNERYYKESRMDISIWIIIAIIVAIVVVVILIGKLIWHCLRRNRHELFWRR